MSFRPAEARDETALYRVRAAGKDNRDGRGGLLYSQRGDVAAGNDDGDLTAHQIGRKRCKLVVAPMGPAVFDRDILALHVACFLEALADRPREVSQCVGGLIVKAYDTRCCR